MLKIKNRDILYQFDVNQYFVTDADAVYIDLLVSDELQRYEVEDGECRIDDDWLAESGVKPVWVCLSDNTKKCYYLNVIARPEPPNVPRTPSERITFDILVERVNELIEQGVPPEVLQAAIEAYLEEHPIEDTNTTYTFSVSGSNIVITPSEGTPTTLAIPQTDISGKVDKVAGKGLSANDYTDADKAKVASIPADMLPAIDISDRTMTLADYAALDRGLYYHYAYTEVNCKFDGDDTVYSVNVGGLVFVDDGFFVFYEIGIQGYYDGSDGLEYCWTFVNNSFNADYIKSIISTTAPATHTHDYNDLTNTPTIPTIPTELPNPNALTFTGAATGEYDGSAPLTIDIPEGGSSGGNMECIAYIDVTEEVTAINITTDKNGNPFRLSYAVLVSEIMPTASNSGDGVLRIRGYDNSAGKGATLQNFSRAFRASGIARTYQSAIISAGVAIGFSSASLENIACWGLSGYMGHSNNYDWNYGNVLPLTGVWLTGTTSGSTTFGVGSRIMLYGIRMED